jgi:hypothetical protein
LRFEGEEKLVDVGSKGKAKLKRYGSRNEGEIHKGMSVKVNKGG